MTGTGSGFTTATININWRKVSDGNYGMVSFLIPPFTITLGTVSPNNIKSNLFLPSTFNLTPAIGFNAPIFVGKGSTRFMGSFYILANGEVGLIEIITPNNWTANSTVCGNPFFQNITYSL